MAIDKAFVRELDSRDSKRRKQAIDALRASDEPIALKLLVAVSRKDPDEQLRNLALNYAREKDSTKVEELIKAKPPKASGENRRRARASAEEALGLHMAGNRVGALKSLRKAVELDPTIKTDDYFLNVVQAVTGADGMEALEVITDHERSKSLIESATQERKQKLAQKHVEEAQKFSLASAAFDIGIYFLIITLGTFFLIFVSIQSVQTYLPTLTEALQQAGDTRYNATLETLNSMVGTPFAVLPVLLICLLFGFGNTLSIAVQSGLIHLLSVKLLGGKGTFGYQVYKLVGLYNTRLPILFLVAYVGVWLTFSAGMPFLVFVFSGALALTQLWVTSSTSSRIAQAYHFSSIKGWLAVTLGSTLWLAINFMLASVLWGWLAAALVG